MSNEGDTIMKEKRGLGRGLSALMADVSLSEEPSASQDPAPESVLPIDLIAPNPDQPRRKFSEEDLSDLAESIRTRGILQPLIVRQKANGEAQYQIVAGERRWRAAQRAQLHEVPVIVREYTDVEVLEVAIIENVQRADLNPIEEAAGYRQLMDRFGHTQEAVAEALGKSRSHIANVLRLMQLPDEVQALVQDGSLSSGHARALITTENPYELARQVVAKGLSVRATEKLAKKEGAEPSQKARQRPEKDADTLALESDLSANLGLSVTVDHKPDKNAGQVVIRYGSLEELDEICRILSVNYPDGSR